MAATGRLVNWGFIIKVELSQKKKTTVFKTVYMPMYGCESWALIEKSICRVQATEMRYL